MKRHIVTIISVTIFVLILALGGYYYFIKDNSSKDSTSKLENTTELHETKSTEKSEQDNETNEVNKNTNPDSSQQDINTLGSKTPENITEPTVINGILLANKKHPLPSTYNPGEDPTARQNLNRLIADAQRLGLNVTNQVSGFRSYQTQAGLYNNYVASHGQAQADRFSARPGYSEHQTGLAFDLIDSDGQLLGAPGTSESSRRAAAWVAENAHNYGFIVRYKPEFVEKTGYMEESWHIRYVGNVAARELYERNISLEDYLNAPGGDYIK